MILIQAFIAAAIAATATGCPWVPHSQLEGVASWYGERYRGKPTASGELFNPDQLTAAHRDLPFGTIVTCHYGGKSVRVRVNDRGPFVEGRVIDLSRAAFARLAHPDAGLIKIKYTTTNNKQKETK